MNLKKTILVTGITIAGLGVMTVSGAAGYLAVKAATGQQFPQIVQNLAQKFNLNPVEVEQVFTDTRNQRVSSALDQAVTAKLITSEQKDLILAKRTEVEQKIQGINDQQLTVSERQTQMQQLRTDVETWANANKIPTQYLRFVFGMGRGHGPQKMEGMMGPGGFNN